MTNYTVTLPPHLESLVETNVDNGRFHNANEVMSAAVRSLQREQQSYEAKLTALRASIAEGDASGLFEGDPFQDGLKELGLTVSTS